MDLWQRLWQDGSDSCDNTVAERTCLGGSVRNSNGIGNMAEELAEQTWLTGPGGRGGIEVAEMSKD